MFGDEVSVNACAWLVLRAVYAWMFLYPAYGLMKDWEATVHTTALLFKWQPAVFAFGSLVLMIFGAIAILLGVYGQFAAVGLIGFNLGGAVLHYRLARQLKQTHLSQGAIPADQQVLAGAIDLGVVGHVTSAEKNFVLTAVAFFFALQGTGPMSIVKAQGVFS
ncbi:MAG: DoxX family membrane protein [Planctomycetota bacterium]|nr:DoxX family membrane protein [Planctomycetota bacterium]